MPPGHGSSRLGAGAESSAGLRLGSIFILHHSTSQVGFPKKMRPNDNVYRQFPTYETDSLLGNTNQPRRTSGNLTQYLRTEVDRSRGDIVLLLCYVITGILDSAAVFIWGSFVSMQTGNTVYLGLGISGLDETNRWIKSLISISGFCIGSFCFAAFHRAFQRPPRQRWVLSLSFAVQTVCLAIAATIVTVHHQPGNQPTKDEGISWKVALPMTLVAFQSSGQAVTSRVLQYRSLISVVLTSIYCDLFSYPGLSNPDEWRRLGAVVGFLLGTCLGGLWAKSEVGLSGALWTAVGGKGMISVAWLWWKTV